MSEESTRRVPTFIGDDGIPFAHTLLSPVIDKVRAECVVPPWTEMDPKNWTVR